MKKIGFSILALAFFEIACNPKPSQQESPQTEEKKQFFPVADYLRSEIGYVDSFPLPIVLVRSRNGKMDSSFIRTAQFDSMAAEFLPPDLDSSRFANAFTESAFKDQTTQAITFTYAPKTDNQLLRRVDVLTTDNGGFDKVKSIYMERISGGADSPVIKKMYWRAKKGFQIITISQAGEKPAAPTEVRVVWDPGNSETQ